LVLSLVESEARHGYEIAKLIELRSGGTLRFRRPRSHPLLYRLEARGWIRGRWVERPDNAAAVSIAHRRRAARCMREQRKVQQFRRSHTPDHGDRICLIGNRKFASAWPH